MAKSQDNGTTILLGLKDYKVGEVWGGEEKVVVKVEIKGRIKCSYCGSGKLYRHGMCQPRKILHTWSNGRRVYLELHRRRWKCRDCKRTFAEGRELVRSRSRLTRQAETEVLWQLKDRNFSQVRRELGGLYQQRVKARLERERGERRKMKEEKEEEIERKRTEQLALLEF
ncbi:transposase family protein [Dehalococcoidia bacterium]|nr:transposase family protein [Dehalococcoidia bacterium]MCL0095330.1 transposase family protein [Dehalococcoidia bacterium]